MCPELLSHHRVPRQELLELGKPKSGLSVSVSVPPTHLEKLKVGPLLPTREPSLANE